MRILFIQGGSRLKLCENGKYYTDGNFTDEVWKRYLDLGDELIIMLRKENKIYDEKTANVKFNIVLEDKKIKVVPLDDITKPKTNLINPFLRRNIRDKIFYEIQKADKIFIRSCSYYTLLAYKACIKYKKNFFVEVAGFAKEGYMHHSLLGRIIANNYERKFKEMVYNAQYALYVTEDALQKRYPCKGEMMGCSDVQIGLLEDEILEKRLSKIRNHQRKIVLGTAAFLDVKWKGQENVIKAVSILQQKGYDVVYEMIGLGTGEHLKKLAIDLEVEDRVRILGPRNHEDVFKWLDSIDIYIQPSYQEGLCRSIVEAMSRACPVISSNAGGNYELVEDNFIFPCGDYKMLSDIIELIIPNMSRTAKRNFKWVNRFEKNNLDKRRIEFLRKYIRN